jgi:predicted small secreted protein
MRKLRIAFAALALASAAPVMAACDDPDTIGEEIDEAGEEIEDEIDDRTDDE